ncbi:uncharacterized membrane protein (DUF485 family) [Herbihabitans rhizosphaerae]|uniref:Uncharacterized membrane protein (DUF485 family) n=1 Tax=Herbihabitans rhizosphaerae TaxID=1872711 RepID=A0A4Q7KH85_9PSEU|nr:DUF485 domain-containing protein [Herbihabitans rhizosphaerae]RZS34248.1 uncharacterized membrane protein (DUF485 family) [Herbihabitans rhizosphaerae]
MTEVARSTTAARSFGVETYESSFGGFEHPRESLPNREIDYAKIYASDDFKELRSSARRFILPMSLLFFLWYLTYVLLAAYARDFMSQRVVGSITVALLLGVLQFVSTIVITVLYLRFARKHLDPRVEAIRKTAGVADK